MIVCIAAIIIGFWPVWQWYLQRCLDRSDEPLGLLSLATLIAILIHRSLAARASSPGARETSLGSPPSAVPGARASSPAPGLRASSHPSLGARASSPALAPEPALISLLILYAAIFPWAPKLVQSIIAALAIACILKSFARTQGSTFLAGDTLLLLLSLPIVASLNFFASFPLRVLSCKIALPLLSQAGFPCALDGTALVWHNTVLQIDPPCSGVKFLWFSLYLSAALSSFYRASLWGTARLMLVGILSAVFGNALRITSLFFLSAGLLSVPVAWNDTMHSILGLICFVLSILAVLAAAARLRTGRSAAPPVESPILHPEDPPRSTRPLPVVLTAAALLAATMPIIASKPAETVDSDFPGWPRIDGESALHPVALSSAYQKFVADFPGKVGTFSDGRRAFILRWIPHTTRQLHSAADCYSGSGYSVTWAGSRKVDGADWSCFKAENESANLLVRERIYDGKGHSYTDASAWYWAAMWQQTTGP
ncbi:MAG: archaeosortase/exosortase family protein, partial [Terriglobales bacterium]